MDPYKAARRRLEQALERSPIKCWSNTRLQRKSRMELPAAINERARQATRGELELIFQTVQKITRQEDMRE